MHSTQKEQIGQDWPARQNAKVLIIGGGVAGLSMAWHLAREGVGEHVVLVEREPHLGMHSSAQNAAILRCLGSDPLSSRIALRSAAFLRDSPPGFAEVPLVDKCGLVFAARGSRAEELAGWIKALGDEIRSEELSGAALRSLAPAFDGGSDRAFLFPDEGQIDIAALMAGFAKGARAGGVELRRDAGVKSLIVEDGCVVGARLTDGAEIRAETSVLAAGGWAGRLGAAVGSRVVLRPTRRHLMVTAPDAAIDRRWPIVWRFGERPEEGEFYCRPDSGGMLLCACEVTDVDPDHFARDESVKIDIATKAARHLPELADAGAAHFWCGLRTLTADGRFAIGPDPDLVGLFWVAGLGGSGMSCGPEVGRIGSALLRGQPVDAEVRDALDPARLCAAEGSG